MNALRTWITVIWMQTALTLWEALHALVEMDLQEMEHSAFH